MSTPKDRSRLIYGSGAPLPFFQSYALRPLPKSYPVDPAWAWESCGSKIITNGLLGSVGGVALGLFMGAMNSDQSAIQVINGREVGEDSLVRNFVSY